MMQHGPTEISSPSLGTPEIVRMDWWLSWGPMGAMALIFLIGIGVLWRRNTSSQDRFEAALERLRQENAKQTAELQRTFLEELHRRDQAIEAVRLRTEETIRQNTKDFTEASRAIVERYHAILPSLLAALEAFGRRVRNSREDST